MDSSCEARSWKSSLTDIGSEGTRGEIYIDPFRTVAWPWCARDGCGSSAEELPGCGSGSRGEEHPQAISQAIYHICFPPRREFRSTIFPLVATRHGSVHFTDESSIKHHMEQSDVAR